MLRKFMIVEKKGRSYETYSTEIDTKDSKGTFEQILNKNPDMDAEKSLDFDYVRTYWVLANAFPDRYIKDNNRSLDVLLDGYKAVNVKYAKKELQKFFGKELLGSNSFEAFNNCYKALIDLHKRYLEDLMKISILLNDINIETKPCKKVELNTFTSLIEDCTLRLGTLESTINEVRASLEDLHHSGVNEFYEVFNRLYKVSAITTFEEFNDIEKGLSRVINSISNSERTRAYEREQFRFFDLVKNSSIDKENFDFDGQLTNIKIEFRNEKMTNDSLYDLTDFIYKFRYPDKGVSKYYKVTKINEDMKDEVFKNPIISLLIIYNELYVIDGPDILSSSIFSLESFRLMVERILNYPGINKYSIFNDKMYQKEAEKFNVHDEDKFFQVLSVMDNITELEEFLVPRFINLLVTQLLELKVQSVNVDKLYQVKMYSQAVHSGRNIKENLIFNRHFELEAIDI